MLSRAAGAGVGVGVEPEEEPPGAQIRASWDSSFKNLRSPSQRGARSVEPYGVSPEIPAGGKARSHLPELGCIESISSNFGPE